MRADSRDLYRLWQGMLAVILLAGFLMRVAAGTLAYGGGGLSFQRRRAELPDCP